ncbi:2OG-Fe(II) oxygenase [Merismopedia glauca]|uniref:Fe2OG dioxygenase domain-containing protein n=1 Tax=Merismopedia glauca CCAP 1448/3 TaxID=1296344 RepID=A0A2T1C1X5_9CYAN|nr:2OG-Fe(II) oxygenase [Merismopedia glauca]PSB02280.1 hypothetical protein C7B64_13945 [Merismopedia glauca CCAP 1448/3]
MAILNVNKTRNIEFLSRAGLFLTEDFLNQDLHAEILAEARLQSKERAKISRNSMSLIDDDFRKTSIVHISESKALLIKAELLSLKPTLESCFNVKLKGCQPPQILSYEVGDFFGIHIDNAGKAPDAADFLKERRVSVVIFLNDQVETPQANSYMGGTLTFYKLIKNDPRWDAFGFPLMGKANLLVAFPSDVLHEVKTVTYGERFTMVTWFV